MMRIPPWSEFSEREKNAYRVAASFLDGRLEERDTIDWAIGLSLERLAERRAILDHLERHGPESLREPWASAWRWIEESWERTPDSRRDTTRPYAIHRRLVQGDRSGAVIAQIVDLVRPFFDAKATPAARDSGRRRSRRPRFAEDILRLSLASGELVDPATLGIGEVREPDFLAELARESEASLLKTLAACNRFGWKMEDDLWRLGGLYRVYYVVESERPHRDHEPDEFHHGIAPLVKLLHAVVAKLADCEPKTAKLFTARWLTAGTPVQIRLWAAMSRAEHVIDDDDIGTFLTSCDDSRFWNSENYPEIAEMRARRFAGLDRRVQESILQRLKNGPPKRSRSRYANRERLEKARLYRAVSELRRIQVAGATIPRRYQEWVEAHLGQFEDLQAMSRVDAGFLETVRAAWMPSAPDPKYDAIDGDARLAALEAALLSERQRWDENPAKGAVDWMEQPGRATLLIVDFESADDAGGDYPNVWNRFGWVHKPDAGSVDEKSTAAARQAAARVLALIEKLPESTRSTAIEGLSEWLYRWSKQVASSTRLAEVWMHLWPIAVKATNSQQLPEDQPDLNIVARVRDGDEPMDLDTLNAPAGKLVGVFLAACPSLQETARPFEDDSDLRQMRDAAINAEGRAGLIACHRMIESISWFLNADSAWSRSTLLPRLMADDTTALALWRAVARMVRFTKVLSVIGDEMANRATDSRLGRESRQSLASSVVLESLHAFREQREPAISHAKVQQMIRSLDDEVRARVADILRRFVTDLSKKDTKEPIPAEALFADAVRPFLELVWPQEHSLATPGVAGALADLPAACGDAFAAAVAAIERFLVPFECWSLLDYGLYGEDDDGKLLLSRIDTRAKAGALLQLLDLTIGRTEGSIIPMELGAALEQVRKVSPDFAQDSRYRRLETLARRL